MTSLLCDELTREILFNIEVLFENTCRLLNFGPPECKIMTEFCEEYLTGLFVYTLKNKILRF